MRSVGLAVTARVPSRRVREHYTDSYRTEIATISHEEQGESLVRKFEQELAELTEG